MSYLTLNQFNMKSSKLRSKWILLVAIILTAHMSLRAVIRSLFGGHSRQWVDGVLKAWAGRLLRIAGISCKIVNPNHVEPQAGQPTIIMCNHTSLYDIPLSYKVFPKHSMRMLAKKELSKIPLMGKAMRATEFPFVDRHHRSQAFKDLEQVKQLLRSGIIMWIAPEGTRSQDGKLGPFKKGGFITAIETQATIIPIGIRGAANIIPARTTQFNLNQAIEIHVGDPIDASQYNFQTRDQLVERTHQAMQVLVGEATADQVIAE